MNAKITMATKNPLQGPLFANIVSFEVFVLVS
jgi:hypothetical protein